MAHAHSYGWWTTSEKIGLPSQASLARVMGWDGWLELSLSQLLLEVVDLYGMDM